MAQNLYDQQEFFNKYCKLDRSARGLEGTPEWPEIKRMVGDIKDSRVLDLGCGLGWFSRWARDTGGARLVHGIDLSSNMLNEAHAKTLKSTIIDKPGQSNASQKLYQEPNPEHGQIIYQHGDLDDLDDNQIVLPSTPSFDLVYSTLMFHYLSTSGMTKLLKQLHNCLADKGRIVFSIEHPIYTAPQNDPFWEYDRKGNVIWPLNGYHIEGPRVTNWLTDGVVKQHRTMAGYISALLGAGFVLTELKEWTPSEEVLMEHPEWENEIHRPTFLLIGAEARKG